MSEIMRVVQLGAEGFKRFLVPTVWHLGHQTLIYGDNDCGKTTIAEILVFVLYGLDLSGNKDYESLMNREMLAVQGEIPESLTETFEKFCKNFTGDEKEAKDAFRQNYGIQLITPRIDCIATISFPKSILDKISGMDIVAEQLDGLFTFRRVRTPKTTTVYLNGIASTQKDFNRFLPSVELFLSVFCPGYFQSRPKECKRQLVSQYCATVSTRELLEETIKRTGVDRKLIEQQEGGLDIICYQIDDTANQGPLKKVRERLRYTQAEISAASAWLKGATTSFSDEMENEVAKEEDSGIKQKHSEAIAEVAKWEKIVSTAISNKSAQEANRKQTTRRTEVEDWLAKANVTEPSAENTEKIKLIAELELEDARGPNLLALPETTINAKCPACGHDLAELFAQERRDTEHSNIEIEQQWKQEHINRQEQLARLREEAKKDRYNYTQQTDAWNLAQRFRAELSGMSVIQGVELPDDAKGLTLKQMRQSLASAVQNLDRVLEELDANIREVAEHNARVTQYQEAKKTRVEARTKRETIISEGAKTVQHLQTLEIVLKAFPDVQVSYQVQSISKYLDKASIVLFKTLANGETRNDFRIVYDGLPYYRLSNSARMKCDLEIARMLNRVSGNSIPVFIDNAEGCTKIPPVIWEQQHILAYVRPNSKLEVTATER